MEKWQKGIIDVVKSIVTGAGFVLLFFLITGNYFGGSSTLSTISENNFALDTQVLLQVLLIFMVIGFVARVLAQKIEGKL